MADFKTHVTFSSAIGAGYAVVASGVGFDLSTSLVAGGLCGVSGMLPDIDSDSGVPRRESLGFAAAIVPMLLIDRFKQMDLGHDQMALLAAGIYFGIRFLAADLIGRWSVHRGMWHSIPAVLIFAGLAFLISGSHEILDRYLKAAAVGLGALSHLVLDEVYSVDTRGVVPKFKKSFGSAVKFFGKNGWANFSTYAKLAAVALAILMEPMVVDRLELRNPELAARVRRASDRVQQAKDRLAQRSGDSGLATTVFEEPAAEATSPGRSAAVPVQSPRPSETPPPPLPRRPASPWFAPPDGNSSAFAPNRSDPPQRFTR